MVRCAAFCLLSILMFALAPKGAAAETSVFYSAPESVWGWCAYPQANRSSGCALKFCQQQGGTACQPAVFCIGGHNAIATPDLPVLGVGITCAMNSPYWSRSIALAKCVLATHALCWTQGAFDGDANEISHADNDAFDVTWYVQDLLQMQGFALDGSDGVMGEQTRAAIRKFQTQQGLTATGAADYDLVYRMLYAAGGMAALEGAVKGATIDPHVDEIAGHAFATAANPNPAREFGDELLAMADDQRLIALATILRSKGTVCTVPAVSATHMFDNDGKAWSVGCKEGNFSLIMTGGFTYVQQD